MKQNSSQINHKFKAEWWLDAAAWVNVINQKYRIFPLKYAAYDEPLATQWP